MKKYLATFFIYDFISAFPFLSLIIQNSASNCISHPINDNKYYCIIIISICLKLFKSVKVKKVNKFIDNMNDFFSKNYLTEQIFELKWY